MADDGRSFDRPPLSERGTSVLVVEDDEALASALERHLTEEGFVVTTVTDGESALSALGGVVYGAVLLDLMLPGIGGLELCERIRSERHTVPVIMTTALAALDERMAGFDAGADDYLVKPFDLGELVARLRAVLRRDRRPDPFYLVAGDLRLDLLTRRAWRGFTELELTNREVEVLELFLRHPGVVLTRRTIMGAVWDRSSTISDNVVDQYVARLRRKIDRPFGCSDLQTLHRVGWRLCVEEAG
ncbi:MAG: response regulator transcription factor [Actinomycetota bacterium]|jgi:two-component system OmpR family response regulator|nr:response regulator transcription factor [Actinomycetota bacterium]